MKINYRQRLLIAFVGLILLAAVWFIFLNLPQQAQLREIDTKISRINQQIRVSGSTISNLPALRTRMESMNVDFDSLAILIPTKDSIAIITEAIVGLCLQNNLQIEYIQPSLSALLETDEFFVKVPIEIQVVGSYIDFGHFVDEMSELPFLYYQTKYDFERLPEDLDLTISVESYIYVINTKASI